MSQLLSDVRAGGGLITSVVGGNNITVNTVAGVATVNVSGTTNHAVQVGNALGALTSIGLGLAGDLLTSNGPGADPSFQTFAPPPVGPLVYAQVYNISGQDVLPGQYITFDSNGLMANISHVLGSDTITINSSGLYLVTFWIESDNPANFEIWVNGVVDTNGRFQGSTLGWSLGSALISLAAGDTVRFLNTGPADAFLINSPPLINANVTFTKITTTGSSGTGLLTMNTNIGSANEVAGVMNLLTANSTVVFSSAGNTITQDFGTVSNLGLGSSFPALAAGSSNVGVGRDALDSITNGGSNNAIGVNSQTLNTTGFFNTSLGGLTLASLSSGSFNTALGYNSLNVLTTTDSNTAVGAGSLSALVTGTRNIAIGLDAGSALTTNESSNIYIGSVGVITENNTIRIGTDGAGVGQQNTTVIAGDVASVRSFTATAGNITAALGDVVITAGNLEITSATNLAGSVGLISYTGSGSAFRFISARGTQNFFAGLQSGNTTLTTGLAIGNTAVGFQALQSLTTGAANTVLGQSAGTAITTGTHHVAIGLDALDSITAGTDNVIIGDSSGTAYTTTESNNIILGANITGTIAESNIIRIGNASNTQCFITGIDGVNVGSIAQVVTESSNQLGTAVITAGSNISITPGANTITIAASGGGAVVWSVITGDQTAVVNNGYFCNKAGTLALALPATSAVGDTIKVININTATGVQFTQAAGQQIFVSTASTTLGATGTLTSSAVGDTMTLVCRTANTIWWAESFVGAWTTA